jgi:predicted DNA-binding transcriptional regulator AlpA
MPRTLAFALVLDRVPTGDDLARLFTLGCDDAAFGAEGDIAVAEFDRYAETTAAAIVSATRAVESAGLRPTDVAATLRLTLHDIADRTGLSPETLLRHVMAGDFPAPVNPGRSGPVFYDWNEVAPWLRDRIGLDVDDTDPVLLLASLLLQARRLRPAVPDAATLDVLLTS